MLRTRRSCCLRSCQSTEPSARFSRGTFGKSCRASCRSPLRAQTIRLLARSKLRYGSQPRSQASCCLRWLHSLVVALRGGHHLAALLLLYVPHTAALIFYIYLEGQYRTRLRHKEAQIFLPVTFNPYRIAILCDALRDSALMFGCSSRSFAILAINAVLYTFNWLFNILPLVPLYLNVPGATGPRSWDRGADWSLPMPLPGTAELRMLGSHRYGSSRARPTRAGIVLQRQTANRHECTRIYVSICLIEFQRPSF